MCNTSHVHFHNRIDSPVVVRFTQICCSKRIASSQSEACVYHGNLPGSVQCLVCCASGHVQWRDLCWQSWDAIDRSGHVKHVLPADEGDYCTANLMGCSYLGDLINFLGQCGLGHGPLPHVQPVEFCDFIFITRPSSSGIWRITHPVYF